MKATTERLRTMLAALVLLLGVLVSACRAGERPAALRPPGPEEPRQDTAEAFPVSAAEQADAAALLDGARAAFEAGRLEAARDRAERVVRGHPRTSAFTAALWIAARAAFELGDHGAAVEHAERYAERFSPTDPEAREARALAERARSAAAAAVRGEGSVARIGVVLPLSGSPYLTQYGELILEGVRLAEEANAARGGPAIELLVRDNRGNPDRSARLVAELERDGVVGVIGPLLDDVVMSAARRRRDPSLVIVSPTAMGGLGSGANVYSLNQDDTRGAEAAAEYMLRAGFVRVGALFPRNDPYASKAEAFMRAMWRAGGMTVGAMPYDSGTTTFAGPMRAFARSLPQAIYIPAPQADVRQIAPQVAYYGLDTLGIRIVGDRAWAAPEVRRRVEPRYLEGVIASTPLPDGRVEVGWTDFVDRYENTYRRSLDNRFPALGHDAALMLFAALRGGWVSPFEVSRRFARLDGVRGATGVLSVRDARVTRRPFMVRIEGGEAVPAPPPETVIPPPIWMRPDSIAADSTAGLP